MLDQSTYGPLRDPQAPGVPPALTLQAVAVGPANGPRGLPEEAPGLGLAVGVPAEGVLPQAAARVLQHVVGELSPDHAGGAGLGLGDGAVVEAQLCEAVHTGERAWGEGGEREERGGGGERGEGREERGEVEKERGEREGIERRRGERG